MVEDSYLSGTRKSITNTTSLLVPVEFLNDICPNKVKDSRFVVCKNWVAKHKLFIVLVKLQVFRFVPFGPIILFHQFSSCEFHHFCHDIPDVTVNDNISSWSLGEYQRGSRFWSPAITELVNAQL